MGREKTYDVLIVGGGVAGVAAAIESARSGMRTAIVEKTVLWGGLATSGLVPVYEPICDGKGRQVTFGISEELLKLSVKYGPGRVPERWHPQGKGGVGEQRAATYEEGKLEGRYMTWFSPVAFVFALDEELEKSGADLWLDTLACKPMLEGARVAGVEVENKSGRIAIKAACVIDASGDADIAFRAGAPCEENKHHPNLLYFVTSLAQGKEAAQKGTGARLSFHRGVGANEAGKGYGGSMRKCAGTDGKDVSGFVMESRRIAREQIVAEQKKAGGREDFFPVTIPTMAQFRMTRKIVGHETVRDERVNCRSEGSIGLIADCRKTGAVWEVPYGALVPQKIEGLLAAGRCIAAESYSWQVTRLIPACALTGQVAALAAAIAVRRGTSPDKLDAAEVRKQAEAKGIETHL